MSKVQPLRGNDYEKVKEEFKEEGVRNYALFKCLFSFGLRVTDVLELKINDIMEGGNIKNKFRMKENKKGEFTTTIIRKDTKQAILDYLATRDYSPDSYLFPSPFNSDKHLSRQQVGNIIKGKAKEAGINYAIGTHSGRKTFARRIFFYYKDKDGQETAGQVIMKALNHDNLKQSLDYIGYLDDLHEEAAKNIEL